MNDIQRTINEMTNLSEPEANDEIVMEPGCLKAYFNPEHEGDTYAGMFATIKGECAPKVHTPPRS
jgi:hypothetical protein